ncbi:hypothetical protein GCM10009848_03320 [Micromonospora lupini]
MTVAPGGGPPPLAVLGPAGSGDRLADVLPSALAVLGVPGSTDPLGLVPALAGVRRIAVLLVDGLGWYQVPTAAPYAPTLAGLAATVGRPLIAGFPSTTPTSLVTLGTGVTPGAHGVLGFTVRVPGTDRVLTHTDWAADPSPLRWQPVPTQLQRARAAGVAVSVVSRPEFGGSGLTLAANRGGDFRGAAGADEVAATMLAALSAGPGPTLVSGYHADLDRHGHLSGVDSAPWRVAATEVDGLLARLVDGLPPDAALLVTADHGQLDVPLAHRFDLDTDPRLRDGVRVVAGEAPGALPARRAGRGRRRGGRLVGGARRRGPSAYPGGDGGHRLVRAGARGAPGTDRRRGGDLQRHVRRHGQPHRAADGVEAGGVPRGGHGRRADRAAAGRAGLSGTRSGRSAGGAVVPPG